MPKPMLEKASETGARLCNIIKFKEHYGTRSDYSINLYTSSQGIKLNAPFPYNGNMLVAVEKQIEFLRVPKEETYGMD